MTEFLLEAQRQLKKDEIVDLTSRLIKQDDQPSIGGMTEVPTEMLKEIDSRLHELSVIELDIEQWDIDNFKSQAK